MLPKIVSLLLAALWLPRELAEDLRVITTLKHVGVEHYGRVQLTVVEGVPATASMVPYMASLRELVAGAGPGHVWRNLCGATIIGRRRVITAAHCLETDGYYYCHHPEQLRIVAGDHNTSATEDQGQNGAQWRKIASLKLHKNFHFPMNDIALVFIDRDWLWSKQVQQVPIDRSGDYVPVCTIAGFGCTGFGQQAISSPVLRVGNIQVLSKRQCSNLWRMNMDTFVCTTSMMSDTSHGDSGGPLICLGEGERQLVGLVSGKNFDTTTLFTRVEAYKGWIDSNGELTDAAMRTLGNLLVLALVLLLDAMVLFMFV